MKTTSFIILLLLAMNAQSQIDLNYKIPPKEIADVVLAEPVPAVSINNSGEWMLLLYRNMYPDVLELAEPELRIAGLRLNPENFAQSRLTTVKNIVIKHIESMKENQVLNLPDDLHAFDFQWNPSATKLAFLHSSKQRVDLYVVDLKSFVAAKVNSHPINATLGANYAWVDEQILAYKAVVANRSVPQKPLAPSGPVIQESLGKKAASRTYQDLLKSTYDEELFEYYTSSVLVVNTDGKEIVITKPEVFKSFSFSPDKSLIMLQRIDKPYSYTVPASGFPYTVILIDREGALKNVLVSNPSTESAPIGFDDAPDFPRSFAWRADQPHSITFVKALDGGLGKSESEWRDAFMELIISDGKVLNDALVLFKTRMRFQDVVWGNDKVCVFYESSYATRRVQMNLYSPAAATVELLHERSSNDSYADIGYPITQPNIYNKQVLRIIDGKKLLLSADGASDEGNMPLLQTFDLKTRKTELVWQCNQPYYEYPIKVVSTEPLVFYTSRESKTEISNFFQLKKEGTTLSRVQMTAFENPYKILEGISREKITYERADGVKLSGNLYLPSGFDAKRDGLLPLLLWAYPIEYKSSTDASQVRGSKNTFTRPSYGSPVFWALRGYAVLDNAEMPIVGENGKEPNDNFIPQLHMNAYAAIKTLADRGVADSNRVAVGGHSYGAFMVANLLAHTNLFKAGIARSGAYNRTLTPFGFQGEERTYWEAPEVYYSMSPFSFADKIKTPLLLIHGDSDNNTGTFPIQSERLYSAIKGNGGIVRYVSLPFESHGYSAKENILHMLWETDTWLEKYVKNAK